MKIKLPKLKPPSKGRLWWIKVNTSDIRRSRHTLESAMSYPIPGKNELYFFVYRTGSGFKDQSTGKTEVFDRLTVKLPDFNVSSTKDLNENKPLFADLPAVMNAQYPHYDSVAIECLLYLVPDITHLYQNNEAGQLGKLYWYLLNLSSPEEFLPYYKALNPNFFDWCERTGDIKSKSGGA